MTDELEDGLISKAEELSEENKGAEALATANELASIDPKDSIVWFVKGKAHYISDQYEEALSCFAKAAELGRENPQVWHMMGYALISLKRYTEAIPCLEYVISKEPQNIEALCALGILHIITGDEKKATAYFDAAIAINKMAAISIAEHFHDKFLSLSPNISSSTKAIVERALETAKLIR